jgi:hypothetical protein
LFEHSLDPYFYQEFTELGDGITLSIENVYSDSLQTYVFEEYGHRFSRLRRFKIEKPCTVEDMRIPGLVIGPLSVPETDKDSLVITYELIVVILEAYGDLWALRARKPEYYH